MQKAVIFQDRRDAGRALARVLRDRPDLGQAIVLALPRGGVPVAFEIARALHLPLDVFTVRKLGVPGEEELAMGAIASGGLVVVQPDVIRAFRVRQETIDAVAARERLEIERRENAYRDGRPPVRLEGRTAILVDDGVATGSSMKAAARALRPAAQHIVIAVPVAARLVCEQLAHEVDQVVCLASPEPFHAVGQFYRNFDQTTDEEVRAVLAEAWKDPKNLFPA
jgi:predicted phosphoribosyltransferase